MPVQINSYEHISIYMTNHLSLRFKIEELLTGIQESKAADRF
jgi:hypothetical protein